MFRCHVLSLLYLPSSTSQKERKNSYRPEFVIFEILSRIKATSHFIDFIVYCLSLILKRIGLTNLPLVICLEKMAGDLTLTN